MNNTNLLLVGLLLTAASGGSGVHAGQADDRFCAVRSMGTKENVEICHLPMARLLAVPEKYDQKLVRITGFLVKHNDRYVMYESRADFTSASGEGGIPMFGTDLPKEIKDAAVAEEGANGVTIKGYFEYGPYPAIPGSPGTIKQVVSAYFTELLRDSRPE